MSRRCFVYLLTAFLFTVSTVSELSGQTLTPGTVSGVMLYNSGAGAGKCPADFWSPGGSNSPVCYSAMMNCANSNVPQLSFIYSYIKPSGTLFGSVVIFSGGSGTLGTLGEYNEVAAGLYGASFEVVEIAWATDWEQTSDPLGIMTAACRPAGFLSYVLQTPLLNVRSGSPTAGLCSEGGSAGAGALAYSLTWYEDLNGSPLSSDFDDAELTSGPAFSNIQLGCQTPVPPTPASICLAGQFGCSPGTTEWDDPFPYIAPYVTHVGTWTNDLTCGSPTGTSSSSNAKWLAMSIVNGTGGSFSYPSTGLAGWLCASSAASSCTMSAPCPNNSAAEGNVYLAQFTGGTQALGYKLTGIINCQGRRALPMELTPTLPARLHARSKLHLPGRRDGNSCARAVPV